MKGSQVSMKLEEANERKENWGIRPCKHERLEKEYYMGAQTGDKVCVTCGSTFWMGEGVSKSRQAQDSYEKAYNLVKAVVEGEDTPEKKGLLDHIRFIVDHTLNEMEKKG